jgi:hypothetical protein
MPSVAPCNLREYVCTTCREINVLKPGENERQHPCDECLKIGTLIVITDVTSPLKHPRAAVCPRI